ncbi:MAG: hypothetical protein IKO55_01945, partial [Kiritimatiellae bacterium]|nr:hypothetical protein [Kiritimatiellia bacterium]
MKNLMIAVSVTVLAALLGSPRVCAADTSEPSTPSGDAALSRVDKTRPEGRISSADTPLALEWKCGPNARIEGNLLIVDVPVGEEKIGGLVTAQLDIAGWDGRPIGAEIVASGERIAKPLHWY